MSGREYRDVSWAQLVALLAGDLRQAKEHHREPTDALWLEVRRRLIVQTLYVMRVSPDLRREVDDIVHDLLLKLQREETLDNLRHKKAPGGYIAMMVRNAVIDLARRSQREHATLLLYGHASLAPEVEPTDHDALVRRLERALTKLSDSERQLLGQRFWENLSIGEIAAAAGLSYSAVAVRLFRLLKRLRRELEGSVQQ